MSLHYAAAEGASLEVMTLLLRADRDAPGKADNVRRCTHTPSRMQAHTLPHACTLLPEPPRLCTANRHRTQSKKRPLHHAAMNGAPLVVMKLLLDANSEAAAATDQARGSAHTALRPQLLVCHLSRPPPSAIALPDPCCAACLTTLAGR